MFSRTESVGTEVQIKLDKNREISKLKQNL